MRRTSSPIQDTNGLHRCDCSRPESCQVCGVMGTEHYQGCWVLDLDEEDRTPRALDSADSHAFLTPIHETPLGFYCDGCRRDWASCPECEELLPDQDGKSHGFRVCECSSNLVAAPQDQDTQEKEIAR